MHMHTLACPTLMHVCASQFLGPEVEPPMYSCAAPTLNAFLANSHLTGLVSIPTTCSTELSTVPNVIRLALFVMLSVHWDYIKSEHHTRLGKENARLARPNSTHPNLIE